MFSQCLCGSPATTVSTPTKTCSVGSSLKTQDYKEVFRPLEQPAVQSWLCCFRTLTQISLGLWQGTFVAYYSERYSLYKTLIVDFYKEGSTLFAHLQYQTST